MQLKIPDEIAAEIEREANSRNITAEEVVVGFLREHFAAKGPAESTEATEKSDSADKPKPRNLAEALGDFIGAVSSKDRFPEGSTLSQDTGRKFTDMLVDERRRESS